jgi:hypothetical protein
MMKIIYEIKLQEIFVRSVDEVFKTNRGKEFLCEEIFSSYWAAQNYS